jgi:hypothetical protein
VPTLVLGTVLVLSILLAEPNDKSESPTILS